MKDPDLARAEVIFAEANAIVVDQHFVLAQKPDGWFHSSDYVNKDAIYPFTAWVNELCQIIAAEAVRFGIDVVVGPTVGGAPLTQWVAHWLSVLKNKQVLAVFADEEDVFEQKEIFLDHATEFLANGVVRIVERPSTFSIIKRVVFPTKVDTRRVIKRGYGIHVEGKSCLIVDDIISRGTAIIKTLDAIIRVGGKVAMAAALCNRSGGKVTAQVLGVPKLFSLFDVDMKMFPEADCPICKERGPQSVRTNLGKGKEFLQRMGLA